MLGNIRIGVAAGLTTVGVLIFAAVAGFPGWAREPSMPAAPLISSGQTIVGETITYPAGAPARVISAVVTMAPGEETGWHTHGMPVLGYMLEGELTVDYGEKGVHVYRAGDAVLEAISVPHNGRNTGSGRMRILAVFMGADGLKTTTPAAAPAR